VVREYTFKYWNNIHEGDEVSAVEMAVPFERVIQDAAATQDYFPGHHNPAYARHQGQKNIYLNTMAIEGFIDRVATDWAGPHTFIRKREMQMRASIYAGDTITGKGKVDRSYKEDGHFLLDISIIISNQDGICVPAKLTIELPCS
jgi:acyl dehydratase